MRETKIILVADDEKEIRSLVRLYLEKDGFTVIEAENGLQVLERIEQGVNLVVLDIMMPHLDGIEVLRQIRRRNNIPVIILSAKVGNCDRILGLDLGADDYMVKPFDPLELVARVKANLRRYYQLGSKVEETAETLTVRDITLDTISCTLRKDEEQIPLTSVEYRILFLMMSQPGRVFTKQQIYEAGWEEQVAVDDNSIMVCISKLRAKLKDTGGRYITTIRGLGYRFEK